jgi:hypothetical protein
MKIKTIKTKIKKLQDELLNIILNDSNLSKIQKLRAIKDSKLFDTRYSLQNIFVSYEKILINEILNKGGSSVCIDDCNNNGDYYDRGSIICLVSDLESRLEDYLYQIDKNPDMHYKINILTSRYVPPETYNLNIDNYIDHVYDWRIENKCVGYVLNW